VGRERGRVGGERNKEATDGWGEVLEGVGGESEEQAALADAGVADEEELEEVVEVGLRRGRCGRGRRGVHGGVITPTDRRARRRSPDRVADLPVGSPRGRVCFALRCGGEEKGKSERERKKRWEERKSTLLYSLFVE
jgi:hypothetical protein